MQAEAALERARRALLLGVRRDERRVEVDHDLLRAATRLPRPLADGGARRAQRLGQLGLGGDPLDHSEGRRAGGDRAEQRRLVAQRAQVGQAVAAVREHHRKVAHHPAGVVSRTALAHPGETARKRAREPAAVGQLREQSAPRVRHQTVSVRADFYGETASIALHPQGDPPELGNWASATRRIPAQSDEIAPRLRPGGACQVE